MSDRTCQVPDVHGRPVCVCTMAQRPCDTCPDAPPEPARDSPAGPDPQSDTDGDAREHCRCPIVITTPSYGIYYRCGCGRCAEQRVEVDGG